MRLAIILNFQSSIFLYIFFFHSNKDEEVLKTYKNVYSKLLRAEKNAPLLSRVQLHMELLQQLTAETGSGDTGTRS